MQRSAIFVDAGYLFAQGSTALTGNKVSRASLSLSARSVIEELKAFCLQKVQDCTLLRIYWYDGVRSGSAMSADQTAIADMDDIKLRLGFINGQGQQKGVDSLIVTDLIELARQKAISEAVLLSGDEDVRVGVQIAQNYGVRVHLLGIHPARGSQSPTLRQEADTTSEWDKLTVEKFLSLRAAAGSPATPEATVSQAPDPVIEPAPAKVVQSESVLIASVASSFVAGLQEADLQAIEIFWKDNRGVPPEFDGKLLAQTAEKVGRRLEKPEMQELRSRFREEVNRRRSR
ncbi:NYN domain-containing protein [Rhizobium binae]|uniref:NYN domain-containing protein n=1 Tax=Rhizobium binae TaxID=1138190 RepID=UPI003DA90A52